MLVNNPEVKIVKKHDFTTFSFRRRNLNFKRYFSEFTDSDAFNNDTLSQLLIECQHKLPFPLHIVRAEINEDIEIDADLREAELIETCVNFIPTMFHVIFQINMTNGHLIDCFFF